METKNEIVKADGKEVALRTSEGFVAIANEFIKNHGEVVLPPNYDVNDAVKALYLQTLQTVDKQKRPVLEVCSRTSIEQVVQTYVSKGLNIAKKQCYLVAYGNTLTLQESYFGKQKQAKAYAKIKINSNVIYKGEEVNIEQRLDGTKVIHHKPDFSKFDIDNIIGAYAVAVREDGTVDDSEIMTKKEIDRSWAKSMTGGTVHKEFPVEMSRKTVIGRLSKKYINTSDDSNKFTSVETDMGDYDIVSEIDANTVITDDVVTPKSTPAAKLDENKEPEMVIDELDKENENVREIPYSEFKDNQDKYRAVPKSYNTKTKTIKVYC